MTQVTRELIELAERVEKAEGADRGLDAEIGRYFAADFLRYVPREPQHGCAPFTNSIDAAMTLVPEGHDWLRTSPETMSVYATPADEKAWAVHIEGKGATPALALCAAALRARSAATL